MTYVGHDIPRALFEGELDLASDLLKVALVMLNTTADTEDQTVNLGDFTSLDEFDGANYTRLTLSNVTLANDLATGEVILKADPLPYGALGTGTRPLVAVIVFKEVSAVDDTLNPILGVRTDAAAGLPFTPVGLTHTLNWGGANEDEVLRLAGLSA